MKQVIFNVSPVRTQMVGPAEAVEVVKEILTVRVPGAEHTKAFERGWDGHQRFLQKGSFPTGLLHRVSKELYDQGFESVHRNQFTSHIPLDIKKVKDCLHGVELRDYQIEAVRQAINMKRLAIQCPTGSGKTEIGAAIIRAIRAPTLWLVHRKELLFQTAERLQLRIQAKPGAIGMIGAGKNEPAFVTVGMVQTLQNEVGLDFWKRWQVLVIDECHHISAETWLEIADRCVNCVYRYGLSGTIQTGNESRDYKLEGATGPLYVAASTMELAEEGFLAKPLIKMVNVGATTYPTYEQVREDVYPEWRANPRALTKMGGKLYALAYNLGIIENKKRNEAIVTLAENHLAGGEKVLILCTRLVHGKKIQKRIQMKELPVCFLHGKEKDSTRQRTLKEFREADHGMILIASTIFDEGVDIPEIDILILTGGGESFVKSIQRVGRALRPKKDKDYVLIYDFLDGRDPNAKKDYLAKHTQARIHDYKQQKFDVKVLQEKK